jgi:hypothetical protein
MKYFLALLMVSAIVQPPKTKRQLFDDFHSLFAKRDFVKMDSLLTDDFTGLDEMGNVSFTKPDYIQYMAEWNTVFNTKWNVVTIKQAGESIKSIEYDTDIFNDFFYDKGKMKYQYTYFFEERKIKSIRVDTLPGAARLGAVFQNRFKQFFRWVSVNHPAKMKYCSGKDKEAAIEVKALLEKYILYSKNP